MQNEKTNQDRQDFPKRWYTLDEVAEITGQGKDAVRDALTKGRIQGAYRKSLRGSSPWTIPGQGAQEWFDVIRGIRRDRIGSAA
jgi:hypothetical protein